MNFHELKTCAHEMAKDKGWWPVEGRPLDEQVCNFHAEISEAWEEYRAGRMETYREGKKPCGFWVEIADLLIRLADSAEANGWDYTPAMGIPVSIPRFIQRLHLAVCGIDRSRNSGVAVSIIVDHCQAQAKEAGVDLWATIRDKLAYNETRPYRHGGKKA